MTILSGLRVLEFGHIASGPYATMLLADLGADVVKVESPQGDGLRSWPPIITIEESSFSLNFASLNRNKRSVVADLKNPTDLSMVTQLCAATDVIVENYRPGVLNRLGLGFDKISELNRKIIYCSISGFGQTGRYRSRGAFDVVVQAMSGLMWITGEEAGPPVKSGVPVADFVAGLYAAFSILAAREVVEREHHPVYLDCAMLDCLLGISALQTSEYWGTGIPPRRLGSAHPRNAPYQAFEAKDGQFVLAAGNDHLWEEVTAAVNRRDLLADPRFGTITDRATNQKALTEMLQPIFKERSVYDWISEFERRGVPCSPVNNHAEILNDEAVIENALVQELPLPFGGLTKTVSFPVRFNGIRPNNRVRPPLLGEHTQVVVTEWAQAR